MASIVAWPSIIPERRCCASWIYIWVLMRLWRHPLSIINSLKVMKANTQAIALEGSGENSDERFSYAASKVKGKSEGWMKGKWWYIGDETNLSNAERTSCLSGRSGCLLCWKNLLLDAKPGFNSFCIRMSARLRRPKLIVWPVRDSIHCRLSAAKKGSPVDARRWNGTCPKIWSMATRGLFDEGLEALISFCHR